MSDTKYSKWSKRIGDTFDVVTPGGISIVGSMLAETIAGQVAPGLTTAAFSYKQKRFEKNVDKFISEIKEREIELNKRLSELEGNLQDNFKSKYFGYVFDYALGELQEDKIKYLVNGLINLSEHEKITEDFVLTYYDTLQSLRLVDLAVLKMYYDITYGNDKRDYEEICKEFGIEYDNYEAVREKLVRFGVMTTQRDKEVDSLYKNVLEIQKFLENINKGKAKKLSRFKKITKNDRYRISRFGMDFVEFFLIESKLGPNSD